MITLKEILLSIAALPIFKNAGFYFGLWGLIITFAPRFGVEFTQAEIGQVTVFISLLFGVTPPTIQYMQVKLYEARVKAEQKTQGLQSQAQLDAMNRTPATLHAYVPPPPKPPNATQ